MTSFRHLSGSMCQVFNESWTDLLNPYTTPDKLSPIFPSPAIGAMLDGKSSS
jgi:hypothetical protein